MNAARRMGSLATAILALGILATPALAVPPGPVGDRINLGDGDQTFPAATPFHIRHGLIWFMGEEPITVGVAAFVLEVDGVRQSPSYVTTAPYGSNLVMTKVWGYNFADGMTGIHTFTGTWFGACGETSVPCGDNPPNTVVELQQAEATVTFTTD